MQNFSIRLIEPTDNERVAQIIRTVMTEFDCVGEGYSIEDPEVDDMYAAYQADNANFYVVVDETNQVFGCGGLAPLQGSGENTCELQKMYFLQEARGHGMGRKLMTIILDQAKSFGFQQIYLETTNRMTSAAQLYQKSGFEPIGGSLGCTGHSGCDKFYIRDL